MKRKWKEIKGNEKKGLQRGLGWQRTLGEQRGYKRVIKRLQKGLGNEKKWKEMKRNERKWKEIKGNEKEWKEIKGNERK